MSRLRCFLFATITVISSATLALGGDIQFPGKSESPPPPAASATEPATDGVTEPTASGEGQIAWLDLATTLIGELPSIF
jgi:hypothetical protein